MEIIGWLLIFTGLLFFVGGIIYSVIEYDSDYFIVGFFCALFLILLSSLFLTPETCDKCKGKSCICEDSVEHHYCECQKCGDIVIIINDDNDEIEDISIYCNTCKNLINSEYVEEKIIFPEYSFCFECGNELKNKSNVYKYCPDCGTNLK